MKKNIIFILTLAGLSMNMANAQLQLSKALDYQNPPLVYYRITDEIRYTEVDFSQHTVTTNDDGIYRVKLPFVINNTTPTGDLFWFLFYIPPQSNFSGWLIFTENGQQIGEKRSLQYYTSDARYILQTQNDLEQQMVAGKYYLEIQFAKPPQTKEIKISVAYSAQKFCNDFTELLKNNAKESWVNYNRITEAVPYQKIDYSKLRNDQYRRNKDGTYSVFLPFYVKNDIPDGELFWLSLRSPINTSFKSWGIFKPDNTFICKQFASYKAADYNYILQSQNELTEQIKQGQYLLRIDFNQEPTVNDIEISTGYSTKQVFDNYSAKLKQMHDNYQASTNSNSTTTSNATEIYNEGKKAYDNKDYAKAYELFLKAANGDHMNAMYELGYMYNYGHHVGQDYVKAREWYEKAAAKGSASAMSQLGILYRNGRGVTRDDIKAHEWYLKAAEKGSATAMYNLGFLYENGYGVAKIDLAKAREWYVKADQNGHATAKQKVEEIDKLIAQNTSTATRTTTASNSQTGSSNSSSTVTTANSSQTAETPASMNQKGTNFFNEKNYAEALKWFQKAADQGYAAAQDNLGSMYRNGYGVTKNDTEAVKWYQKAADQGHATGQNNLGFMYQNGTGVTKNYTEAVKWYQKAADQGNATAQVNLGAMYKNGYGVSKNYTEALKWYQKAADQGDAIAMNNLGVMYHDGTGVSQDYAKARDWYVKAINNGNEKAKENLATLDKIIAQNNAASARTTASTGGSGSSNSSSSQSSGNSAYDEAVYFYKRGDYDTASNLFGLAAMQGHAPSQYYYAVLLEYFAKDIRTRAPERYNKELDTVFSWFKKSAEQGFGPAQAVLYYSYQMGRYGERRNETEANKWYQRAKANGVTFLSNTKYTYPNLMPDPL